MKKMIRGEKIVKSFGVENEKRTILNGVSIEIAAGEFISVMGPSGSGKSTLLFALSGMDEIDQGKIIFDGQEISKLNEEKIADIRRTQMGMVFQQPYFLKNLNIIDNIILPAMREQKKSSRQLTQIAMELMKATGIEELAQREVTQVSGGQLQRAGICRALMNQPKIILGDEPTGALNSKASEEIMALFSKINAKGTTIMLVTHDAKVAAQTERVLFMKDGKIESELKLKAYKGKDLEYRTKTVMEQMNLLGI